MPPTALIYDCQAFAQSIVSAGGELPGKLANLLSAYTLLSSPAPAQRPEDAILDHARLGTLDERTLAKLLPVAAAAAQQNAYRQELVGSAERVLVGQWHRALKAGCADEILTSLRPKFDTAAAAIAHTKALGVNTESTLEHLVMTADDGMLDAWRSLDQHLAVIRRIAAIASAFGCRPQASYPQVKEFSAGETYRIDDRALMTTAGELVGDSALFMRPDQGHRTSPFFRVSGLRLHSIAEAQARHDQWAAGEHDRIHSRALGGWVDERDGTVHEFEKPENPFRTKVSSR